MTSISFVRESLLDASAVLLPVRCAGCGGPDRSLCATCGRELVPRVTARAVGGIPVWSALEYAGAVRRVLLAYKESGRVDAAPALSRALRAAVVEALRSAPASASGSGPGVVGRRSRGREDALLPVLVPSTAAARRRRGFHPSGTVLARAHILVPPLWRALRLTRQTRDQAGLSSAARAVNRRGSMAASARLRGRRCLIVDDIVTSGATIVEAARAIDAAGGRVVGAATIAVTPRRGVEQLPGSTRTAPRK
jgi:predicted amidophosphoribosyltransferase